MILPTLYKLDKAGKTRFWKVWVKKDILFRHDGIDSSEAKVKEITEKKVPQNKLRNGSEQAIREANRLFLKKIDEGFKPNEIDKEGIKMYLSILKQKNSEGGGNRGIKMNIDGEVEDDVDDEDSKQTLKSHSTNIILKPPVMLAKDFFDKERNPNSFSQKLLLKEKIAIQPKLDGIRCIAYYDTVQSEVKLISRKHKEFVFLNHIRKSLYENIFKHNPTLILDGEIYFHDLKIPSVERYQFVSSVAKIYRNNPHPEEQIVSYWIFDIIDEKKSFENRLKILINLFKNISDTNLTLVSTDFKEFGENEKLIKKLNFLSMINEKFTVDLCFEGIMLRDVESVYKNGRQAGLLKYKTFFDEDWTVVGAHECIGGAQQGAVVWLLQNEEGLTVEAKQTGSVEESVKLFKNKNKYIGKKINIRFNEKTEKGIPRFPRAIAFVEDK